LQGRGDDLPVYRDFLAKHGIKFDAICCKDYNISLWQENPAE